MEAAIRWSPHSTPDRQRFLLVDVASNRLRLYQTESSKSAPLKYKLVAQRDKLPNFTAFDWSKTEESLVAVGSAFGEATLIQVDADRPSHADFIRSFPIRHPRKCNSIAFSVKNALATGLDRVRNDFCMNIYDLNATATSQQLEPLQRLATSEAVYSIRFFAQQPDTLVAGVSRQYIRLFDLRGKRPFSQTMRSIMPAS